MSLIEFLYKAKRKIDNKFRKLYFRKFVNCPHKDFTLLGKVTLINKNIKLGHNVTIYPDCMFFGDGLIEIGDNVDIGNGTIIYSSMFGGVSIGNNVSIAGQCYIIDMDHGTEKDKLICKQENSVLPVKIGQDVWIGAGVKVLKGSVIHDGAVIGAASLVKGEIEENAVAVGIPAKIKKFRE